MQGLARLTDPSLNDRLHAASDFLEAIVGLALAHEITRPTPGYRPLRGSRRSRRRPSRWRGLACRQRPRYPQNKTLFPILPYSPDLNPVETIWEFLRGN